MCYPRDFITGENFDLQGMVWLNATKCNGQLDVRISALRQLRSFHLLFIAMIGVEDASPNLSAKHRGPDP